MAKKFKIPKLKLPKEWTLEGITEQQKIELNVPKKIVYLVIGDDIDGIVKPNYAFKYGDIHGDKLEECLIQGKDLAIYSMLQSPYYKVVEGDEELDNVDLLKVATIALLDFVRITIYCFEVPYIGESDYLSYVFDLDTLIRFCGLEEALLERQNDIVSGKIYYLNNEPADME